MSDDLTLAPDTAAAPTEQSQGTPTAPATGFAEAGAALREAKTWADLAPKVEEPVADATATSPVDATEPAEATETQPDAFEAFTMDEAGRLHRPDGTFADAGEVEAYNATVEPASVETEPAAEPILATVRTRDGKEIEFEVTDPDLAEAIRANHNDGMRRDEFRRRIESVEQKEAEVREFVTMLETNPEAVILQHLPSEKQISIATALIAQHWDAIYDRLLGFEQDPSARIQTAMDSQLAIRDQQATYQSRMQATKAAAEISRAVDVLIPAGVNPELEQQFWSDAQADLIRAANSGQQVTPENVNTLLAARLRLYAPLWGQAEPVAPPAPEVPKRPLARPVAKPSSAPASAVASVSASGNAGATVRRLVSAQRVAAAVPPAGAGAAPMSRPMVPTNATIEEASKALRKAGNSWANVSG